MAKSNALTEWLGIPATEQPPNHYRLLGLPLFETDRAKIDAAAEDAMARVRKAAGREQMELAGKVLTMLKSARTCLLNDAVRQEYDARLRESLGLSGKPESAAPVIDTGQPATAGDRAKNKKKSSLPMILAAAVAGGGLAAGLVFSGVIPLFKKPAQKPDDNGVVQNGPAGDPDSPSKNPGAGKKQPVASKGSKVNPVPVAATAVYLTELTAHDVQVDAPGFKFKVNQRQPEHGLWLHPAKGGTGRVAYKLGRKYRWLQGVVVVPDKTRETRDITVRFIGDNRVLWESNTLRKRGDWQQFTVDVADVDDLAVVSRSASGNYVYAQVALVEPRLLVDPAKPAAVQVAGVTDAGRDVGKTSPVAATEPETKPVDLLKLIDANKHAVEGNWSLDEGALITSNIGVGRLQLPGTVPTEYDIDFTATRLDGEATFVVGLVAGGRQFAMYFDYGPQKRIDHYSALAMLKGKVPYEIPGAHHGKVFKLNEAVPVSISVRKTGVTVSATGKTIYSWKGDYSDLKLNPSWAVRDPQSLFLGSGSRFKVTKFELRPLGDPKPATIDLLKLINPKSHTVAGTWNSADRKLVSSTQISAIQIPYAPPAEYELQMKVKRTSFQGGHSWLNLALNGGGRRFWVLLDHDYYKDPRVSGLHPLDGKKVIENETTIRGNVFEVGKETDVVCRVSKDGVTVTVGGRKLIDWKGDYSRFGRWESPLKDEQMGLLCETPFEISELKLRPLRQSGPSIAKNKPERPILCKTLATKRRPDGLSPTATAFNGPRGDGRSGANGIYFPSCSFSPNEGTAIEFEYSRSGTARGLHVIHPYRDGHFVVLLHEKGVALFAGGQWTGYLASSKYPLRKTPAYDATFPIGKVSMVSIVRPDGTYQLFANGKEILTSQVAQAGRFRLPDAFQGQRIPLEWPAGSWGMLVGPMDQGSNTAANIRISSGRKWTRIGTPVLAPENPLAGKLAIPDAAKQKESLALVKDVFKKEYAAADKPLQKALLAAKLLAQSRKTVDDETAHYVLLRESQRLATEGGDVPAVMQAIDELAARFAIDPFAEKTDVLRRLSALARRPAQARAVAEATLDLAKTAAEAKQFDAALKLLKLAGSTAGKARLRTLVRSISDYRGELIARQKQLAAAEDAAKTLQLKPDDPEANRIRGKYLCFVRRDWEAGLPMLAKGDDAGLKKLAQRELKSPTNPKEMVDLADAWYDAALKSTRDATQQTGMAVRAVSWYREAEPSLKGLYKTKVEKQLAEIARRKLIPAGTAIGKPLRARTAPSTSPPKKAPPDGTPLYVWEIISGATTAAKGNLRVEFRPDGTTNHGHKWTLDGKKFACGWDSGGLLVGDGTFARGRWFRGAYFTGRLLMKNASLKSAPAPNATLSKTAGRTPIGRYPIGKLSTIMVDCWEFTARTRDARRLIRLSVDFTADGQVIDAGRKIATWEVSGRKVLVKFLDEQFGTVTFGRRNANQLFGLTKVEGKPAWSCQLDRVQQVAVYKAESLGTLTFYSNGRINKPRHVSGLDDMHWCFDGKLLRVGFHETDVSADGKTLPRLKGTFVAGRPLIPPR